MATGKQKVFPEERKKLHAEARAIKVTRKRAEREERNANKFENRKSAEEAAAATDPKLRQLISHVNATKQTKNSSGRAQPVPPPALFDLIHSFLKAYKYIKAAHSMRTDHQKTPEYTHQVWLHRGEAYPSLLDIFDQWYHEHPEKINEELYDIGQTQRAADRVAQKELKKIRSKIELGEEESKKTQIEEVDTEEESDAEEESASDSDSSDTGSTSDSDDNAMSVTSKSQPVVSAISTTAAAPANPLKRKASSSSSSNESSGEESSSESEDEDKTKDIPPPAKKAKVATIAADPSSSSPDSESDSSSSGSSSSLGVEVAKAAAVAVLAPTRRTTEAASSSSESSAGDAPPSSDSSDSSDPSDSSDSSDDEGVEKTSTQPTSASRSNSDSSATLPGNNSKAFSKQAAEAKKSSSPSSSSSSSSTSSDSSDSSSGEEEEKTKKTKKTPKPPKDILVYHEPLSKTKMKKDPLAAGEEKRLEATANNFKKLKEARIPFSRIPADVQVDEKFANNKFVPYDYAAKAHENLIVTKGKGFTKAKNKGKRGSYRGGPIDTQGVRAIKFDD